MNKKNYKDILNDPTNVIPSLNEKEIKLILIETILAYTERSTDLVTVVNLARLINKHSQLDLSINTKKAIEEIMSMHSTEVSVSDILDELIKRTSQNL